MPVLLVVALACLVLGVLFASSPWLIGSLVAGAVAAAVLYRHRSHAGGAAAVGSVAAGPTGRGQAMPAPVATAVVTGTSFAARRRPRTAEPRADLHVWVVDGRPAYHLGQCTVLDDLPAGIIPERVPLLQALEDNFVPCPTCQPTEERLAAGSAAVVGGGAGGSASGNTGPDDVWVVDGRPRYHRPGCASVAGLPAEPIPHGQAVVDGFTPCPRCEPDAPPR